MSREDEIRTAQQNRKLHAMCRDLSEQVQYAGRWMGEESWKRLVLGAAHGQITVPNPFDPLNSPPIVINKRTSSGLVIPEMADLLTQMMAFGDERGVKWGDDVKQERQAA